MIAPKQTGQAFKPDFFQIGVIVFVLFALFVPPMVKSIDLGNFPTEKILSEKFVLDFYGKIDQGEYNAISPNWLEADWEVLGGIYKVTTIKSRKQVLDDLHNDYGTGGWRIRFIDLKTHGARQSLVKKLPSQLQREKQILEFSGFANSSVTIVKLSGHTTGRCSIHDWQRELVLAERGGKYHLVFRGVPPKYQLLHREQLFFPRDF